ncbi:MAG: helix-turn-helix domain-containing protein [Anaeroplasma sp.]|uniref:helix-turn-helix domain-containing protein n=1 Tax=Anaeroplasma sp. TaxID=1872523 RepID=UPI002A911463|nr:helix-turn-helix domain-containing protein [Anaeroplasma sp.]MDY5982271.1 helix-turn-helix domain-containing protein [Anaeroplasma sp.]
MNKSTIDFVNRMKSIRKEKGLSQIELAKRCNVPQSTIGRIENHSMNPSLDMVMSILNILNVNVELVENAKVIKGYDVFGKEYGCMLRNDLHDINSIEHKLMQEMVRLDSISEPFLYGGYQISYPMENNILYSFAQRFKRDNDLESIKSLIHYTSQIATNYNTPLDEMYFGGTEKEILDRGTDWCFDLARLAAVILDCLGMTSRFVFVANPDKAYHGHVLIEVFYNDSWGVVDPLYGYVFYDNTPISAKDIYHSSVLQELNEEYKNMFKQVAIVDYNPNNEENKYIISKCNKYTLTLNSIVQDGTWKLGEDK